MDRQVALRKAVLINAVFTLCPLVFIDRSGRMTTLSSYPTASLPNLFRRATVSLRGRHSVSFGCKCATGETSRADRRIKAIDSDERCLCIWRPTRRGCHCRAYECFTIAAPLRCWHACLSGGGMQRKKQVWAMVAVVAAPTGGALGRLHLIGPNPGTFFVLGILAALSVVGSVYGFREGQRVARSREPIGN